MIKIGILGMSPGNAHPSSWSAIINGVFDGEEITRLGYPAVAEYLTVNNDTLGLPAAKVTHVWAQEEAVARQISRTAGIAHTVAAPIDLVGRVDAVILARDDPENHRSMAKPFIDAGIPIFIDKPLCATKDDLDYLPLWVIRGIQIPIYTNA